MSAGAAGTGEVLGCETLFDRIRSRAAEVTRRARDVRIDDEQLAALASELATDVSPPEDLDPMHQFAGSPVKTLAFATVTGLAPLSTSATALPCGTTNSSSPAASSRPAPGS